MLTLKRCTVYFLMTATLFLFLQAAIVDQDYYNQIHSSGMQIKSQNNNVVRQRRAIGKPGFFWTLGSSIFQTFNETKSAYHQIRNLINDQFIDERPTARTRVTRPPVTTTSAPDAETTEPPYRISRREFNRILMRNLRGLVRLYNLELEDALKQSVQNEADFHRDLRVSIKKELS